MEDKKARPFIKFHSVQALILAVINGVVAGVLTPVVFIGCITGVAGAVYMLYIGYKAYQGETVTVPFITTSSKAKAGHKPITKFENMSYLEFNLSSF